MLYIHSECGFVRLGRANEAFCAPRNFSEVKVKWGVETVGAVVRAGEGHRNVLGWDVMWCGGLVGGTVGMVVVLGLGWGAVGGTKSQTRAPLTGHLRDSFMSFR